MRQFQNVLGAFAVAYALVAVATGTQHASAGDASVRTVGQRNAYESQRLPEETGAKAQRARQVAGQMTGQVATNAAGGNCVASFYDRNVGGQRVWTPHGVITVGGRTESVQSTECR